MLRDLAWSVFEKTGNIEAFLEYSKLSAIKKGEENDDDGKGPDN
jgi:hypothetical protein